MVFDRKESSPKSRGVEDALEMGVPKDIPTRVCSWAEPGANRNGPHPLKVQLRLSPSHAVRAGHDPGQTGCAGLLQLVQPPPISAFRDRAVPSAPTAWKA